MRRIFILAICFFTLSCSTDDGDFQDFSFEILPIDSVEMPESFTFGEIYNINYTYEVPSSCHVFNDLYYIAEENTRTVAVINTVFESNSQSNCEVLTDVIMDRSFRFIVTNRDGSYIFKFWQGVDSNCDDIYEVHEVPVIN